MTYPPPPPGQPGDPYSQQYPQQPAQPGWDGSQQPGGPVSGVPASGQPAPYGPPNDPYGQPQVDPYGQPMSGVPASGQPMSPGVPPTDPYGQPMSGVPASGQPMGPGYGPPDPYGQQQWSPPAPPPPSSGSKAWIWGGIVGVVVVALMIVGALYITSDDGGTTADPTPSGSASAEASEDPSDEPTDEPDPDADLITDPGTGLSYERMGDPWYDAPSNYSVVGFTYVTGQVMDVLTFDDGSGWIATFTVGEVDTAEIGFTDEASLEDSVNNLADLMDATNYNAPPDYTEPLEGMERGDVEIEDLNVGGHSGKFMSYHLSWDDDSIEETGESVAVGVIDMGDGRAAGIFLSLPDSVPDEHLEQMLTAMESLTFV